MMMMMMMITSERANEETASPGTLKAAFPDFANTSFFGKVRDRKGIWKKKHALKNGRVSSLVYGRQLNRK